MAERSSSSTTMSRTRCAGCPSGTNSCTEGGSSQASSTFQGRKLFVMPPSESPHGLPVEPFTRYPDELLALLLQHGQRHGGEGGGADGGNRAFPLALAAR